MATAVRAKLALLLRLGGRYFGAVRGAGYLSFLSLFAIIAMALGVAALVIVLAVMNGFQREIEGRLLQLLPAVSVQSLQGLSPQQAEQIAIELNQLPGVSHAYPQLVTAVMAAGRGGQRGAQLRSVASQQPLHAGHAKLLAQPFTAVVGAQLARQLGVRPGDSLVVTLPRVTTTPLGLFPRSRRLQVVDTFALGAQLDSAVLLVSSETADRLLSGRAVEREVAIELVESQPVDAFIRSASAASYRTAALAEARWQPWYAPLASFFAAVALEKRVVAALLAMIVIVAGFNIVATLAMTVTAKRKEIAVLRTLGLERRDVVALFMLQGLALGGSGIVGGLLLGLPLAYYLPELIEFFQQWGAGDLFDPTVFMIHSLPTQLLWADVVAIIAGALLLTLLATLPPAWRAGSILPSEALRYDR